MVVQKFMSSPAVAVWADTGVQEALKLMHERKIRRLPIVDTDGKLVGIVSERDLLYASPSPATSLSVWELNYLLARLAVKSIMQRNVIVATPEMPLREVARLMLNHKIGGLPVVDTRGELVGIITESDIFRAFLEQDAQQNG